MSSRLSWLVLPLVALAARGAASPSPTLSARQAASSPLLVFNAPSQPTSCLSTLFTWIYAGPDDPLSLTITNAGVSQESAITTSPRTFTNTFANPVSRQAAVPQVSLLIAVLLDPTSGSFNWPQVAVEPGFYVLVGTIQSAGYSTITAPFFVQPGDDLSCLSASSSSSPSTPTPSSTSRTLPSQSPSSSPASSPASSDAPPTATPIGGSSSETQINKGAIAGGVVAGVAVLLGILAVYIIFICLPRRRSRSPHARSPSSKKSGDGDGGAGRWGGLSSVDSHMVLNETPYTKPPTKRLSNAKRHHSTTSSGSVGPFAGGVGASQDDIQLYLNGTRSRSGSVAPSQHYGYTGSLSGEKYALGAVPGAEPVARRSYSVSSHASEAPVRRASLSQGRRSVDSQAQVQLQLQSPFGTPPATSPLSGVSPPVGPALARAPSAGSGSTVHPGPPSSSSHAHSPAQAQGQPPPRKTPRKPVPAYTSSPPASPSASPAPPALPPTSSPADQPAQAGIIAPIDPHPLHPITPTVSQGHYATRAERESLRSLALGAGAGAGNGNGNGKRKKGRRKSKGLSDREWAGDSSANASRDSFFASASASYATLHEPQSGSSGGNAAGSGVRGREVAHKSSFGPGGVEGRPLHYLIPDLPPQQT